MDDANSDYYAAHGSDVVTCVGCVLTGDLPLTALDAESGSVVDDVINFNIQSLQPYRKGGDPGSIYYKIKLKEYREVRIRQVKVSSTGTATVSGGSTRTDNRVQAKTYTVKPGDCLYNISKSTLGDGGRYNEIYSLNKDKLKNPNLIYPGQVLQLP